MNLKIKSLLAGNVLPQNKFKLASLREMHTFFAIIFAAQYYGGVGSLLWDQHTELDVPPPDFGARYGMKHYRFEQIKRVFPFFFTDPSLTAEQDECFKVSISSMLTERERFVPVAILWPTRLWSHGSRGPPRPAKGKKRSACRICRTLHSVCESQNLWALN